MSGPVAPRGSGRRARRQRAGPEDSITLRLIVGSIVLVGIAAVVAGGTVDAFTAVAALVLTPIGFVASHVQRHKRNVGTKLVLAVALLAAFGAFLQDVRLAVSVEDARVSLASLFLWVQVLHAFDVPRRRDLAFSVTASLILLAEAGSLSLDTSFALFLLPWTVLAGAWLYLTAGPRPETIPGPVAACRRSSGERRHALAAVRAFGGAGVAVMLAASAVFLATPRLPGTAVITPPFSIRTSVPVPDFSGQVVNPGLEGGEASAATAPAFSPSAYPGFGGAVDLRSRGRLSDEIVMKVRSPEPALWRGQAFDTFDGIRWSESSARTLSVTAEDQGYSVPSADPWASAPTERLVQTFYVQAGQPNVVFGAYRPEQAYFPAAGLRVDGEGSVRSPIILEDGMIYSVVSEVPVTPAALLRSVPSRWPRRLLRRYTQLPPGFSPAVTRLAEGITAGSTTTYGEVTAVQQWLRTHTEYDLTIPPDPAGTDPIATFLLQRRRGYCEHIASAMALMLRSVGIPTRLVTGFGPGERNALTGYFEVRQRDAHAWVEVLYPGVGWVPYDPTFGVPTAQSGLGDRFIAPEVLRAIARLLASAIPDPVKAAAGAAAAVVAALGAAILRAWPTSLALLALVCAGVGSRRGRRRRGPAPTGAAAAFLQLSAAMAGLGRAREQAQTPAEYLGSIRAGPDLPPGVAEDAAVVVRAFERERFSASAPTDAELGDVRAAAARVRERTRRPASRRPDPRRAGPGARRRRRTSRR